MGRKRLLWSSEEVINLWDKDNWLSSKTLLVTTSNLEMAEEDNVIFYWNNGQCYV